MVKQDELVAQAREVRLRALVRYSDFRVGAAVLGASGRVWTGCNVESASYGLTCCAERVAMFKAVSEGEVDLLGIAVVADCTPVAMPCGACRQVLHELAPAAWVVCANLAGDRVHTSVADLLPHPFDAEAILKRRS